MPGLSVGQGNLGIQQHPQTVPPFPANAADNGVSVDPVSKKIVLGDEYTSTFGGLAQLLNSRQIYLAGFSINFLSDPAGVQGQVQIDAQNINVMDFLTGNTVRVVTDPAFADIVLVGLAANPSVQFLTAAAITDFILRNNSGSLVATTPGGQRYLALNRTANQFSIGDLDTTNNGIFLIVDDNGKQIGMQDTNGNAVALFDLNTFFVSLGDLGGTATGLQFLVDVTNQRLNVTNTALNAKYAVNNNDGASGTFTTVDLKTVTVEGGIITAIV